MRRLVSAVNILSPVTEAGMWGQRAGERLRYWPVNSSNLHQRLCKVIEVIFEEPACQRWWLSISEESPASTAADREQDTLPPQLPIFCHSSQSSRPTPTDPPPTFQLLQ